MFVDFDMYLCGNCNKMNENKFYYATFNDDINEQFKFNMRLPTYFKNSIIQMSPALLSLLSIP